MTRGARHARVRIRARYFDVAGGCARVVATDHCIVLDLRADNGPLGLREHFHLLVSLRLFARSRLIVKLIKTLNHRSLRGHFLRWAARRLTPRLRGHGLLIDGVMLLGSETHGLGPIHARVLVIGALRRHDKGRLINESVLIREVLRVVCKAELPV